MIETTYKKSVMIPIVRKENKKSFPLPNNLHKTADMIKISKDTANGVSLTKGKETKEEELKKACTGFEAIFFKLMMSEMRKTAKKNNFLGENSFANDTFVSMLDSEIADNVAKMGNLGIAEQMYKQLSKNSGQFGSHNL